VPFYLSNSSQEKKHQIILNLLLIFGTWKTVAKVHLIKKGYHYFSLKKKIKVLYLLIC
jgi:hypothetical protein